MIFHTALVDIPLVCEKYDAQAVVQALSSVTDSRNEIAVRICGRVTDLGVVVLGRWRACAGNAIGWATEGSFELDFAEGVLHVSGEVPNACPYCCGVVARGVCSHCGRTIGVANATC